MALFEGILRLFLKEFRYTEAFIVRKQTKKGKCMSRRIGGIEAGGTKMVCAIGNENGELIDRMSIPTETPQKTLTRH